MPNFQAKDFIAVITLISIVLLKFHGLDGQLDAVGALVIGYYFGHRKDGVDSGK